MNGRERGLAAPPPELVERRRQECRLTPEAALQTIDEAAAWVVERGLVTRTPDTALPSLFEACHEEAYVAGGKGFAAWPATKWWWAGALEARHDIHVLKIHRGKNLFLSEAARRLADPVLRSELHRMEHADPEWRRLLGYLAQVGPTDLKTVQEELGLKPKELKAIRSPLERCGALVATSTVEEAEGDEGHLHTSVLARYDQAFPEPVKTGGGLDELVISRRAGGGARPRSRGREVVQLELAVRCRAAGGVGATRKAGASRRRLAGHAPLVISGRPPRGTGR